MLEASMAAARPWRTLNVPGSSSRILVKSYLGKDGYRILLTDLSRVWDETLDRAAVIKRASEINCSIEPSEDDQYCILLDKIESSLKAEHGTSFSLHSEQDGRRLKASISAPLPSPLPAFRWSLYLDRLPDSHTQIQLVSPLLARTDGLQREIESLLEEIRAKDRVISKITDRLESSGNDLTTVFPGVANVKISRKRAQRTQLAKYIKGLGDFEEDEWRTQMAREDVAPELSDDTINQIFEGAANPEDSGAHLLNNDQWWTDLKQASVVVPPSPSSRLQDTRSLPKEEESIHEREADSLDSDFQRQPTPTHLARHEGSRNQEKANAMSALGGRTSPKSEATASDDDVTEEEKDEDDDLDAPSRDVTSPQVQAPVHAEESSHTNTTVLRGSRKLGTLGGAKRTTSQPVIDHKRADKEQQSPVKPKAKLGKLGGPGNKHPAADASDSDANPMLDAKPKGKLGVLGGKAKNSATVSPREDKVTLRSEAPTKPDSSLSHSGNRSPQAAASSAQTSLSGNHHKPAVEETASDREEVNSQERADQKRDKLKRELAEKAKAPVKKKRKF